MREARQACGICAGRVTYIPGSTARMVTFDQQEPNRASKHSTSDSWNERPGETLNSSTTSDIRHNRQENETRQHTRPTTGEGFDKIAAIITCVCFAIDVLGVKPQILNDIGTAFIGSYGRRKPLFEPKQECGAFLGNTKHVWYGEKFHRGQRVYQ